MSVPEVSRGGAPVGFLSELGPVEAGAVMFLRMWSEGPDARASVRQDFSTELGITQGRAAARSFSQLVDLCARHGRRPLMRHGVMCRCLGADESCFANFIGYAAEGAREDAMMMATLLVRADMAAPLTAAALDFGLALRRMAAKASRYTSPTSHSNTLH